MSNEFVRNIQDATKIVTTALPAAGANVTSTAIDLEQVTGGILENIAIELSVPATPALVEAKVITFKLFTGATTTLAVCDPLIQTTITGGTGGAGAAKTIRFRLPPNALRYVGVNAAIPADGGNNTGVSFTVKVLF